MKFPLKKRKHQYYLLASVSLIVLFFIGYRLITNKITSEAEGLMEVVIKQYAKEPQLLPAAMAERLGISEFEVVAALPQEMVASARMLSMIEAVRDRPTVSTGLSA